MSKVPIIAIIDPRWHGLGYIEAALKRGYKVIPIVPFAGHPTKWGYDGKFSELLISDITSPEAIIKAIEGSKFKGEINAILPGNDYFTPFVAKVAAHLGIRGESYEAAMRTRLKDLGRDAYDAAGLANARYAKVTSTPEALQAAAEMGYPVVLKPTDAAGSEHVTLARNDNELTKAMVALLAFKETQFNFKPRQVFLVEEYITGQEFSVEMYISDKKVHFASVTEKLTTPLPYFVEIGHVVPTSVYIDRTEEIVAAAHRALMALGFSRGPFHVELRLSKRGPIIMETNGRMGGGLIVTDLVPNAFGVDLYDVVIEDLLGHPFDAAPKKRMASAIANLVAPRSGRVVSVDGEDKLSHMKNIIKYKIRVKPGDMVSEATDSEKRLGFVITVADTPAEAKSSAFEAIGSIKLDIE